MSTAIIILVVALVIIIVGLLLSGSGSSAGLTNISGQDLEIFKKSKDRGIVKVLQITMFFLALILVTLILVFAILDI